MPLCEYCTSVDFGLVGYHKGACEVRSRWNRHSPDIKAIKLSAQECFFCRKIITLFYALILPAAGNARDRLHCDDTIVSVSLDRTTYTDDEGTGESMATLVRLSVIFSNLTQGAKEESIGIYFQKAPRYPVNVTSMLNEMRLLEWPSHEPYTARIRPLVMDLRVLDKWKEICLKSHKDECGEISMDADVSPIRLIDVEQRCIVDRWTNTPWIALSYVWGKAKVPRLILDTLNLLQTPGCLTEDFLPATIQDAMTVTRALGVSHLWVDSLCIIQDDEADKAKYIPQMASIYGNALLTIIDAAGEDAHHGLPGIRPGSRAHQPEAFNINGAIIVESLEPPVATFNTGSRTWASRGWTFQESILARRRLIFNTEQVSWECNKCVWREDLFLESPDIPPIFRTRLDVGVDREQIWKQDSDSFEGVYRALVAGFSARHLTYDRDGLDAIDGVLTVFTRMNALVFHWGLPLAFLCSALTWSTDPWNENIVRRKDTCKLWNPGNAAGDCPFPSWSWVGWVGAVELDGSLQYENAGLIFYIFLPNGTLSQVKQVNVTKRFEDYLNRTNRPLPDYSWRNCEKTAIDQSDVPATIFHRKIRPSVLAFWTSTAVLEVRHGLNDYAGVLVPQVLSFGEEIEVEWRHKPQYIQDHLTEHSKFAVIGRHYLEIPEEGFQLTVMMLGNDETGLVSRRGLIVMFERNWIALDDRKWERLFLR